MFFKFGFFSFVSEKNREPEGPAPSLKGSLDKIIRSGNEDHACSNEDSPYHPLTYTVTKRQFPRPAIHEAVARGDLNTVAEILKQNPPSIKKEDDNMSDLSHSDSSDKRNSNRSSSGEPLDYGETGPRNTKQQTTPGLFGRSLLNDDDSSPKPSEQDELEETPVHSLYDSQEFTPLHVAASLDVSLVGTGVPAEMTRMLLSAGSNVGCTDRYGNTALHWAARAGNGDVAHLLTLKNCTLDAKNNHGETALFWAMRAGRKGQSAVRVLIEDGARPNLSNKQFKRPLDMASIGFDFTKQKRHHKGNHHRPKAPLDPKVLQERRECRANLLSCAPSLRTLVLHHPECLDHIPKSESDWECPDRITSILSKLTETRAAEVISADPTESADTFRFSPREITVSTDFERASLELISRVHSAEYLAFVNELSKTLEKNRQEDTSITSVPFTPHVQREVLRGANIKIKEHSDTSFSAGSLRAARRAAGSVQHAVDR